MVHEQHGGVSKSGRASGAGRCPPDCTSWRKICGNPTLESGGAVGAHPVHSNQTHLSTPTLKRYIRRIAQLLPFDKSVRRG